MSFEIYDYRTTNRNVLVTPEIRARLYHMQPSQVDGRHSHDLGHEVFLILEGEAEFNIGGVKKVLGPGQMCVALADEIHQVRNTLPDKPTIMYLSVTPHIQPTHTGRTDDDQALPPVFRDNQVYDAPSDLSIPVETLIDDHLAAAVRVAGEAERCLAAQQAQAEKLRMARAAGEAEAAAAARNAMWDALYLLHKRISDLDRAWNELAPRAAGEPTA